MRSILIGFAALSLFVVGCERKDSTDNPQSNVGGGPGTPGKTEVPSSQTAPMPTTGGTVMGNEAGAESLAGGGAKTGAGANGPAMGEKATADAGK